MDDHSQYADWLPLYVSGALDEAQHRTLENHLTQCSVCRSDVALWQQVAHQVADANRDLAAPPHLVERALAQARVRRANIFRRAYELVHAQVPLVRGEMWLASAVVMAIGVIVATIVHDAVVLQMLAPMVAAASIAVIYGAENDPALELTLATATSPWKILLARLALVFGFDLLLALAASGGMLMFLPANTVASLILGWLGPMTFLSAAALVLALWVGAGNAIAVSYVAWLMRFLPEQEIAANFRLGDISLFTTALDSYRQFWSSPLVLALLSVALVAAAGWLAGRQERHLPRWT
jgi:Putative zinc-finger